MSAKPVFRVVPGTADISLHDGSDEIAYWDIETWRGDPRLVLTIAEAVFVGCTEGPDAVRAFLRENESKKS